MIKQIENGFEIYHNNLLLIRHTKDNPVFFIGEKKINIDMVNGEFDIKDDTVYQPLNLINIDDNKVSFNDLEIVLSSNEKLLSIKILEESRPIKIRITANNEEQIYGLGEHFTSLNHRGHVVKNWVEEHITRKQIYSKILRRLVGLKPKKWKFEEYKTYYITPTYISSKNYFLHVDSSSYGRFDFTNKDFHEITFLTPPKEFLFGVENSILETSALLCKYQGIMPKLPDWIYDGMILAIQGGSEVCDLKVKKMIIEGAKINGIWSQDWCGELYTFFGKQVLWNWEVDNNLYPNLEGYIDDWKKLGVKFLAYINPYLNANEKMFEYAKQNDFLVKDEENNQFLTKATSFDFGIVDLTNPKAYSWFKEIIKTNYIKLGIKGWMADFGEYLPAKCKLYNGTGEELHNSWPDLWVKLNREALEETDMLGEIVFFNRAGYKDSVKHTTLIWNGDQHVDFTDDFGMGSVVRASLSLSLSGIGFSHSDVGGYTTVPAIKRSKELFIRWLEMNTFTPVLRSHEGNKPWVNKQFDSDQEIIESMVKFTNIHVLLKPYFQAVEEEYHQFGYPMIRPTFMHFDYISDKSFLLGSDLYVCPVVKKRANRIEVIIPSDNWVHLFTGKKYDRGTYKIDSPLGTPPVFYKDESKYKEVFLNVYNYINNN